MLLGDALSAAYQQAQLEICIYAPKTISVGDLFQLKIMEGTPARWFFSGVDHIEAGGVIRRFDEDTDFSCVDDSVGLSQLDCQQRILHVIYRKGPLPRGIMYSKRLFEESRGFRHDLEMYRGLGPENTDGHLCRRY